MRIMILTVLAVFMAGGIAEAGPVRAVTKAAASGVTCVAKAGTRGAVKTGKVVVKAVTKAVKAAY